MAENTLTVDPDVILAQYFELEVGNAKGIFTGLSGLSLEVEQVDFSEGNSQFERKYPGRQTYGDVTLKRGYTDDTALSDWFNKIRNGQADPRDGAIYFKDRELNIVDTINIFGAWPSGWQVSDLAAGSDDIVVEEMTLVIERFQFA